MNNWFEAVRLRVRRTRGSLAARVCAVAERGGWGSAATRRMLDALAIDDGLIEFAGPWSQSELLLDGWFGGGGADGEVRFALLGREGFTPLPTRICSYRRPEVGAGWLGKIAVIGLDGDARGRFGRDRLFVIGGRRVFTLTLAEGCNAKRDVIERMREWFATRSPSVRRTVREFLGEPVATADPSSLEDPLRSNIAAVCRSLVDDLSWQFELPSDGRAGRIELAVSVGDRGVFLRGALRGLRPEDRVELVSAFGERIDLAGRMQRLRSLCDLRPGLPLTPRFVAFVPLPGGVHEHRAMRVEIGFRDGQRVEMGVPAPILEPDAGWRAVLESVSGEPLAHELVASHVHLALDGLLRLARESAEIAAVHQFGSPPVAPRVSILIPLGAHIEWIEHQLAHLAADPDARAADVVLVLDAPDREVQCLRIAEPLSRLYDVPFRVVVRRGDAGEISAVNAAARFARARQLLLLGPGVFPRDAGWIDRLIRFAAADPHIGVVGPKLVQEDGSIVHAGLDVDRSRAHGELWLSPFLRGLPAKTAEALLPRPVAAVSPACLLVDRDLFATRKGLSERYVELSAAAADFCLRLAEHGLETWYTPEPELFALEFPNGSGAFPAGDASRFYDAWLLGRGWADRLVADALLTVAAPAPSPET